MMFQVHKFTGPFSKHFPLPCSIGTGAQRSGVETLTANIDPDRTLSNITKDLELPCGGGGGGGIDDK